MASERIQRHIERLLDRAYEAFAERNWLVARDNAQDALRLEPENRDALTFLAAAERALTSTEGSPFVQPDRSPPRPPVTQPFDHPTSFANSRYQVKQFLGEGGKKRVYRADDTLLDREVAFALIKAEGMDETSRTRIQREAQAMGRLGFHPHFVTVFDLGQEQDKLCMVTEMMGGGDRSFDRECQVGKPRKINVHPSTNVGPGGSEGNRDRRQWA